jgi:hypothetical protein
VPFGLVTTAANSGEFSARRVGCAPAEFNTIRSVPVSTREKKARSGTGGIFHSRKGG